MPIAGYYFLSHNNVQPLWIPYKDGVEESLRVRGRGTAYAFWPIDPANRLSAWTFLVESLAMGASNTFITDLAREWGCDNVDAQQYATLIGCELESPDLLQDRWRAYPLSEKKHPEPRCYSQGDSGLKALAKLASRLYVSTWVGQPRITFIMALWDVSPGAMESMAPQPWTPTRPRARDIAVVPATQPLTVTSSGLGYTVVSGGVQELRGMIGPVLRWIPATQNPINDIEPDAEDQGTS